MTSASEGGFDLAALYIAVNAKREAKSLTWAALSREVGVAASTIRRFAAAADAEADGVLMVTRWLGTAPETFVPGGSLSGDQLPPDGVVRVDMNELRQTAAGADIKPTRTRTTIQQLAQIAAAERRSIASLTRTSAI